MARYGRYTYERFVRRDPVIEKEYVLEAQRADTGFTLEALLPSDRARIVRLCARLSGDLDAAEDLAQETLVEAWRNLHKLHDQQGRAQWLSAIAVNVCRRWGRRHGREMARMMRLDGSGDEVAPDLEDGPADAFDLEVELERDELATLLDRAMALLPPETRMILVERYIRETPVAEVAARLGVSEGLVAVRLHRGKLQLRQVLATELRNEAVAYGLASMDVNEWQETRIWCSNCGQRRLRGWFDRATGELAFGCPDCCPEPIGYSFALLPGILAGVKGYRAALSRQMAWSDAYYRQALAQHSARCMRCGRPASVRIGLPEEVAVWLHNVHAVHVRCEVCQPPDWTTLTGLALDLPEGRRFWRQHQRIRTLPEREIEVDGRAAILASFESVAGTARLDVVSLRDTFEVIGVYGAPREERN